MSDDRTVPTLGRWRQQQPSHWDIEDAALTLAEALAEEFAHTGVNGIAAILEHTELDTLHTLTEEATRIRMARHGLIYRPKNRKAA